MLPIPTYPQVWLYLPCRLRKPDVQEKMPPVGEYHYVLPQGMDDVVDNMYNAAYKSSK